MGTMQEDCLEINEKLLIQAFLFYGCTVSNINYLLNKWIYNKPETVFAKHHIRYCVEKIEQKKTRQQKQQELEDFLEKITLEEPNWDNL